MITTVCDLNHSATADAHAIRNMRPQKVPPMLGKCATSSCSASFRYLDEGRLFRVEYHPGLQSMVRVKPQYFWLCPRCSELMTLRLDRDTTVKTILSVDNFPHNRQDVEFIPVERKAGLLLSCFRSASRERSMGWQRMPHRSLAWAG